MPKVARSVSSGGNFQSLALGKARAVLLLDDAGDDGNAEGQNQTEDLNGDQGGPQFASLNAQPREPIPHQCCHW